MNSHNIHVRFERDEAIEGKKDILSIEERILVIAKRLKRYHEIRLAELKLKAKLQKRLKEVNVNIGKLQKNLPKPEIPEIIKDKVEGFDSDDSEKREKNSENQIRKTKAKRRYDSSIESQIEEIRNKISEIENQGY